MMALPCCHCRNSRERPKHVVLLDRRSDLGALGGDHEWDSIHAKAGHTELNPETHDLEDLGLDAWIGCVEVGLEVVETMEVPRLGFLIVRPGGLLHAGKYHAFAGVSRLLVGPHIPVAVSRVLRASRFPKPWMRVRSVVDHETVTLLAVNANPDAYARCPEADASTRTVIPVMIAAALNVSLARSIIIRIFHDNAAPATGPIASAILVTDQANLPHKIRVRVFVACIDASSICAACQQRSSARQKPNRKSLDLILLVHPLAARRVRSMAVPICSQFSVPRVARCRRRF